jgi:hypothetical protein
VSFGCELANWLNAILYLDAQSGGSNARIIRTTRNWIEQQTSLDDVFVLIQWSTWERQEWLHNGEWWQVNASGTDHVPPELIERYKQFVANIDWVSATRQAHQDIWEMHQYLKDLNVKHLFFSGNSHFEIPYCNEQNLTVPIIAESDRYDWDHCYIGPYDHTKTYNFVLQQQGFATVNPESWHFGPDAHCFWGEYLLQYIKSNKLLEPHEIPTY